MSFDSDYARRSDKKEGWNAKRRQIERNSFAPKEPRGTGYEMDECKFGMDDIDRIRRNQREKVIE